MDILRFVNLVYQKKKYNKKNIGPAELKAENPLWV